MLVRLESESESGSDLFFEVAQPGGRKEQVTGRIDITSAERTADSAVEQARSAAVKMLGAITGLDADEAEIAFGLKMTGEAGLFAITKVGGEAQCTVRLKWKRPDQS